MRWLWGALALLGSFLGGFLCGRPGGEDGFEAAQGAQPQATHRRRLQQRGPDGSTSCFGVDFGESPVVTSSGRLLAPLHVASFLPAIGGAPSLVPAAHAEKILFELGANSVYTVRDTLLKQPAFKRHFVLSFEPLLDKYATNLAARSKAVMRASLGHHHRRGLVLPMAVGPREGMQELMVSDIDGCSSLLNFSRGIGAAKARPGCSIARERRLVPTVTLRTALGWLPAESSVEFLKSDIQGMDLQAIESAGDQVHRLQRVQMEVALGHKYNEGSPTCHEVHKRMDSLGFRLATGAEAEGYAPLHGAYGTPLVYAGGPVNCDTRGRTEADMFFIRRQLGGPQQTTVQSRRS